MGIEKIHIKTPTSKKHPPQSVWNLLFGNIAGAKINLGDFLDS